MAGRMKTDHRHTFAGGLPRQKDTIELEARAAFFDAQQGLLAVDKKRPIRLEFVSNPHNLEEGIPPRPARSTEGLQEFILLHKAAKSSAR
jgi:hypothetical protein